MRAPAILLLVMLVLFSCDSTTPGGFWDDFKKASQKENLSDQGPYGGHRAMYWKSEKKGMFTSKEVLDFASENGWELVDSLEVQANDLKTCYYNDAPIFPLSHTGFSVTPVNSDIYKYFPRPINAGKIYRFKTGWVAIEPGTDASTEVNGFIFLGKTRSEMSVYHLWGE